MDVLNEKHSLRIGPLITASLGFMCSSMAWTTYNHFTPILLKERFVTRSLDIGLFMSIDNLIVMLLSILIGYYSDKTTGRFGKRLPWLALGIPVSAGLLFFIPLVNSNVMMVATIILFNFSMAIWKTPSVALMPDITVPEMRSPANGIVNFIGGLGNVIAFLIGAFITYVNNPYACPFGITAVVMLIISFFIFKYLKEPVALRYRVHMGIPLSEYEKKLFRQYRVEIPDTDSEKDLKSGLFGRQIRIIRGLSKEKRRSFYLLLAAIFFWFLCFYGISTFNSLAIEEIFQISGARAARITVVFSAAFMLFSVPAGFLGKKWGRKNAIRIGLLGLAASVASLAFLSNFVVAILINYFSGTFWGLIIVNALPMVVDLSDFSNIGSFVAIYYTVSNAAAILSPLIFGYLHDRIGSYRPIFVYSSVACLIAFALMSFVHHEENRLKGKETLEA